MALVMLLFLLCVCVFFLIYVFYFLAVLGFFLLCWLFSSCGEQRLHSNCGAWAASCGDFSCRAPILEHTGFSSCGPHDEGTGSVVVTCTQA